MVSLSTNNNLYAIDGNKIVSVGDVIKENNYAPTTGEAENFPSFKWLIVVYL